MDDTPATDQPSTSMVNEACDSAPKLYSVPRRFDIATILVVTFAYALLFNALRWIRAPSPTITMVAVSISCVGIGQALLFRGKKPRMSSILSGVAVFFCIDIYSIAASNRLFDVLGMLLGVAVGGTIFGYVAGVAVGSVFLVSDKTRKLIQRFGVRQHEDCR